ncbi:ABI family, member 3 (NESH) binding protein b isoform X2 [Silurus meridionalis]|uniref:ABI family, member 3 (NESH) binding protein b isoform X2 n=1 Tax=Silurus meridionalis TaxID=175797 RepID=UPI001EEA770C|nr:ABI family, member 3 (NESH) binding protein b isoform X2 [Silurus meridionalis]
MSVPGLLRCILLLSFAGILLLSDSSARRIRGKSVFSVRRQNMKVRINATGDTIVLKFLRPNPDVKLEGYILGYGSSMFSKQFIQLPENGKPYETEIDAEPKYLVAVQPIKPNDVKKQCMGKVNLDKPLNLVIGTVSSTSVLLSWGPYTRSPYEGNIMNDCLEDGYYTIRYRERNRKWIYQTCPTSDTVIDNLKPNTHYEFGVRPNKDDRSGMWSKPVIHSTNTGDKIMSSPFKPSQTKPGKPTMPGPRTVLPPPPPNRTHPRPPPLHTNPPFPGSPKTSFAPPLAEQETALTSGSNEPKQPQLTLDSDILARNASSQARGISFGLPHLLSTRTPHQTTTDTPQTPSGGDRRPGLPQTKAPSASPKTYSSSGQSSLKDLSLSVPPKPVDSTVAVSSRNRTAGGRTPYFPLYNGMRPSYFPRANDTSRRYGVNGQHHKGLSFPKPVMWSRTRMGTPNRVSFHISKNPNQVGKTSGIDKKINLHQDKSSILKPKAPLVTAKPAKPKTTTTTPVTETHFETWENSSAFSSVPASKIDAMGKERFIAPHVVYKTDKKPDEPCSITRSLSYFLKEQGGETTVTGPPRVAPSNLTVVTVEGCPSFVILDWNKVDNQTTEYEVISTTKGPDGQKVSILTTNQTHTAVENLKPESSYEFKVKPKNELGEGPPSEPVTFNTESADPRVSEYVSGKDAIWTQFPFKTDSYSECNGKQYVKRTWYRKFVGIQLCNSLRYKIYLSDSLNGKFYNIGDQTGHGEDHCQFVDSFLDGRTGTQLPADQLEARPGYFRAVRQEPVHFGQIGGNSHITYVAWYECGTPIPGKW